MCPLDLPRGPSPPIFFQIYFRKLIEPDNLLLLLVCLPNFCTFRRLCSAFLASILCFLFRYTVSVRVEEKQPYRQRTYTWCWAFPPRCSKYKIQIKTIYRTEVSFDWIIAVADYGRPMKPFFIEIPNFWAWADNLGR